MDPELEELLKGYDAAVETRGEEAIRLRDIYESRIAEVLKRRPGLSAHSLQVAVELAYSRWKKAQHKYPTLPPKA